MHRLESKNEFEDQDYPNLSINIEVERRNIDVRNQRSDSIKQKREITVPL